MADTAINVPLSVRSHEVKQLQEMVPRVIDTLDHIADDENKLGEDAATLERVYDEHIEDMPPYETEHIAMPTDDWQTVVRTLSRLRDEEGLRVWWLRGKLVSRLKERLRELEGDGSGTDSQVRSQSREGDDND